MQLERGGKTGADHGDSFIFSCHGLSIAGNNPLHGRTIQEATWCGILFEYDVTSRIFVYWRDVIPPHELHQRVPLQ
jgi:hypothetical protein